MGRKKDWVGYWEDLGLLEFAMEICGMQLDGGRFVLHEHPKAAKSWSADPIRSTLEMPDVYAATCNQRRYGATTFSDSGELMPPRKPTRFMSSSRAILGQLSLRCRGTHRHQQLLGSGGPTGASDNVYD